MLLSNFIMVTGLIVGYMVMIGVIGFAAYITFELMLMKARGVKIVRRKRR